MKFEIDTDDRIVTVDGIRYSFGLFAAWASSGLETDTPFAIVRREEDNGQVVIERLCEDRAAELFAALREARDAQ